MGPLAQFIARYGVIMGKAMWEASKKGIALFKKPTISDKKRKVLDKQRKEYEADEKAGIKAGNKMSDADYKKQFKALNDKALKDKKIADRADKIVDKKEKKLLKQEEKAKKPAVKSAKKFRKDTKGQEEGKKYNPDPRTDSMNYSDKEAREFGREMSGRSWSKKEALEASLHHDKALMNVPVAATAVAGTTASLISKRKNKNKNKQ